MNGNTQLLNALIENSDDAILSVSPEGKILTFNRAAERMFDYDRAEILGKSAFQLVPLGYGEELQENVKRIGGGQSIEHYEAIRMKKDGTRFQVSIRISPIRDESANLIGMSWVVRDITQQKKAEAAIRLLSSVVEQTADTVMISDKAGVIEYVNPAFVRTTGYSKEEALGNKARLLKSGQHPAKFYRDLWNTILEGRPFRATMINRKKSGDLFYSEKTITPIKDESGEIIHFVSTDKDITDKQLAEQYIRDELTRSNEDLRKFASVASHDLQEPLRTICTYLNFLRMRNEDLDSESKEYLGFVLDAAARLRELVQDVLTCSKIEAQMELAEFDVVEAVRVALANLRGPISQARAEVEVSSLPRIKSDFQKTVQLFQNLIGNSIKYHSGDSPLIKVTAERSLHAWVFKVSDNGIGIAKESLKKIFQMFHRLHGRSEIPGTGLGLSICKKIVEQRGGEIWVESILGRGSLFYFTVPDELPLS